MLARIKSKVAKSNRPISGRDWILFGLVMVSIMVMTACGGGNSSTLPITVSGNWQFTMEEQLNSNPALPSFSGGLQGGFLVQNGNTISGQVNFLIMTQPPANTGGNPTSCNNGVTQISGTISGQNVTLTAQPVGAQTYTLNGTLSYDGSMITGTYSSTDGQGCGIAATAMWSASLMPVLNTTSIQGTFHSMGGSAGLAEQEFQLSGQLFQGLNNGASSAPLTGNLNFGSSGYPCFSGVTVTGQVSGNSVYLQILGSNNTTVGQVGQAPSTSDTGLQPLTIVPSGSGFVLQSSAGVGYAVFAPACGGGTLQAPADSGSVCLAVNNTNACQLPLSITPAALGFAPAAVGSSKTSMSTTLLNPSSSAFIDGLSITLTNNSGQANFAETDNCGPSGTFSNGQPFLLQPSQFCTISVSYSPQQACPSGGSGSQCLSATLSIASSALQTIFDVPVTGGVSGEAMSESDRNRGATTLRTFEQHAH
jgi:hypothetical protein